MHFLNKGVGTRGMERNSADWENHLACSSGRNSWIWPLGARYAVSH